MKERDLEEQEELNGSFKLEQLRKRLWIERGVFCLIILLLGLGYVVPFEGDETGKSAPAAAAPERYALVANGKVLAAVPSEADARTTLEQLKARYAALSPDLAEEPAIKEKVEIQRRPVPDALFRSTPQAAAELLAGSGGATHLVASGDTAWKIAHKAGLPLEKLAALNPGVNLDRLAIGDKIRVGEAGAAGGLTVVTKEVKTVRRRVPAPVQRIQSAQMYRGKEMVVAPGHSGLTELRELRVYENGVQVATEKESKRQVRRPSLRKVVVGTKPRD